jgi:hypothetical protein
MFDEYLVLFIKDYVDQIEQVKKGGTYITRERKMRNVYKI